jgi:3-oxoacid CoA-transferase subunit B
VIPGKTAPGVTVEAVTARSGAPVRLDTLTTAH